MNKPAILKWAAGLILLFLAVAPRFWHIEADAPGDLLIQSREFQTDEGAYLHNAVHKALFNQWFVEHDFNTIAHTPLYSLIHYLNFKIFGVGWSQARILTALLGLAAAIGIGWIAASLGGWLAGGAAFSIMTFSHAFLFYNRIASAEILVIFFMVMTMVFWIFSLEKIRSQRYSISGLAGLLLAVLMFWAATTSKPIGFLLLPVLTLLTWLDACEKPAKLHWRRLWPIGLLLCATGFFYYVWSNVWIHQIWNYWLEFTKINIENRFSLNPARLAKNYMVYFTYAPIFFQAPITVLLAIMGGTRILWRWANPQAAKPRLAELAAAAWFWGAIMALGFFAYSPLRFNLLALPPACILSAWLICELWREGKIFHNSREALISCLPLLGFGAWQLIHGILKALALAHIYLAPAKFYRIPYGGLPANPGFGIALGAGLLCLIIARLKPAVPKKIIAMGLLGALLSGHLWETARYFSHEKYSMLRAAEDIDRQVRKLDARAIPVLAGDVAPNLALHNHLFAIHSGFDTENSRKRMRLYAPKCIIASTTIDIDDLRIRYRGIFPEKFIKLAEYPIFQGQDKLILYQIPAEIQP